MIYFRRIALYFFAILLVTGCGSGPVRHLASDAALISAGTTKVDDVLLLLGEPDTKQLVSEGIEKWVYYEEDPSLLQGTPVLGDALFKPNGYKMIALIIKGELVIDCKYSEFSDKDYGWSDDFGWQEKK